jgi:transposase-like protein
MDPHLQFCHNPACRLYGERGGGTIRIHSRRERRYRCTACGKTFAETAGTPFYRTHVAVSRVVLVLTLLAHGCPVPAIVAAFGYDERTVRAWLVQAGTHAERVHEHLVEAGQVELGVVQADELWVKVVGQRLWLALALAVPSRLWLGGVLSPHRDGALIEALVGRVRAAARSLAVVVCVDGLGAYVTAFRRAFRVSERTGRRGRPRQRPAPRFGLGQVVKRRVEKAVVGVSHRAVVSTLTELTAALVTAGCGTQLNTAFIERLNATFRARSAPLTRRGRRLVREPATLHAWTFLVGGLYNFCQAHRSLRLPGDGPVRWQRRTPAMAAGLTDHVWTVEEFLRHAIPQRRLVHWDRRTGAITATLAPPERRRNAPPRASPAPPTRDDSPDRSIAAGEALSRDAA